MVAGQTPEPCGSLPLGAAVGRGSVIHEVDTNGVGRSQHGQGRTDAVRRASC